ncbi:toprim domain-containing protein [Pusillimonas sp.]|uniref:DUF7146 domain-containing protein n=1 Tax=Pusillimonas sp. TaxID=3040095 RepID=UPI0037C95C04
MIKDIHLLEAALRAGGLIPDSITAGGLQRCKAEGDKGSKRSGAYRLFDDEIPTCIWWNWKTSDMGVWVSTDRPLTDVDRNRHRQLMEQAKRERQQEQAVQWAANREYLVRLWDNAEPLTASCPAGAYLERRGLVVPNTDALRYMPKLDYWDGAMLIDSFPAMLAAVTDNEGALVNVHRTYLNQGGDKARVPTVKKLCKSAGPMAGASIKLGQPAVRRDGRQGLGVAEGIETAIAATILAGVPVWSCVSAHGLASFEPPRDIHHLYVFADNDESQTGQKAAADLGNRVARMGLSVRILTPETVGDWNDELLARRAAV